MSKQDEIQAMLKLLAGEQPGASAGHPSGAALAAYKEKKLEPKMAGEIQDHLVACEDCRLLLADRSLLEDLVVFPELPEPPGPKPDLSPKGVDTAWSRMKDRILAEASQQEPSLKLDHTEVEPVRATSSAEAQPNHRSAPRFFLALAASFLLGLIAPSIWLHSLQRKVERLSEPQAGVAIHDLFAVDDPLRGAEDGVTALDRHGPGQLTFILHLTDPPTSPLAVQILDASGLELWSAEDLRTDPGSKLSLAMRRDFLPAGDVRIVVFGRVDGSQQPVEVFQLSIRDTASIEKRE